MRSFAGDSVRYRLSPAIVLAPNTCCKHLSGDVADSGRKNAAFAADDREWAMLVFCVPMGPVIQQTGVCRSINQALADASAC